MVLLGLDDPNIEDEDEELVEAVRALPETDSLPAHLEDFERQTSLVQMEVSKSHNQQANFDP